MDIEAKHRELDKQIEQEQKRRTPDLNALNHLKREKLALKDQITGIR